MFKQPKKGALCTIQSLSLRDKRNLDFYRPPFFASLENWAISLQAIANRRAAGREEKYCTEFKEVEISSKRRFSTYMARANGENVSILYCSTGKSQMKSEMGLREAGGIVFGVENRARIKKS